MLTKTSRQHKAAPAAADTADLFQRAVRAQLSGDLAGAEELYGKVLERAPRHAEALNNLGAILAGRGDRTGAAVLLRRAVDVDPHYGEALNNLGLLGSEAGEYEAARGWFSRATTVNPDQADWLNNLANACVETGRPVDALAAYDRAITIRPGEARFWSNRGVALRALRRAEEAMASFRRALELDPGHVNALGNLGMALKDERRYPEAIAAYERATALDPASATLVANLASVFESMGDFERMRELALRAASLDATCAEAVNLLANHELESARYDAAESLYWKALALEPGNRNANWNLAIIWLLRGDYERGWEQFEWRRRLQSVVVDTVEREAPEWDGTPLAGRTILLATEQGLGDAIQFIRYAQVLKDRAGAGRVVVECAPALAPLLATVPGVDQAVPRGAPPPSWDTWANLMSLPRLMGTTLGSIPAPVPYLRAEPRPAGELVSREPGVLNVGLAWCGNPLHKRDHLRSVDPARLAPLVEVPGTRFYSLQKGGEGERRLPDLGLAGRVMDLAPHLDDLRDTAAVIARLDLVITVDTAVAHLAAALGKPTWILLPHVPDFRWLVDRPDSPWYPTARLFRQARPGDWDDVVTRLGVALRSLAAGPRPVGEAPAAPDAAADGPPDSATPATILQSATRMADGRPRFDLWFPLARLADPAWFTAWESELLAGGYHRPLRDFWDEAAHLVDAVVDLAPVAGIFPLSLMSAERPARRVLAVEPDPDDAVRLADMMRGLALDDRVHVVPDETAALDRLRATGATRLGIHAPDRAALETFARAAREAGYSVAAATCPGASDPADVAGALPGLTAFAASRVDGDVQLDPLPDGAGATDAAWLSDETLRALHGITEGAPVATPAACEVAIDWELRGDTGWGVYGTNLALALLGRDGFTPTILAADESALAPLAARRLRDVLRDGAARRSALMERSGKGAEIPALLLRGFGNNFGGDPRSGAIRAARTAGVIFFEDTRFDDAALALARALDLIVAGSTWNADVLRAAGLANVEVALQGIDRSAFHPGPRSGHLADRFVVFSGGKLEYRKGQDIVVAAFRRFRRRHPEALLLTAWHNPWPHLVADLDLAGHVRAAPRFDAGSWHVGEWLAANGIPPEATLDVGRIPNVMMGAVVREADVALFPNRCEGGTNLVAMECMAAGVPTIVSANTGHLDLTGTGACLALTRQGVPRSPTRFFRATEGWGESDVDEVVEALERIHADRQAAEALGRRAASVMEAWSWPAQVDRLLALLRPLLP